MPGEYAFDIDSNVGRYWLANGEGFDVVVERGPRVGVVEDVVLNPYTHEVSSVVVRRRLSAGVRRPAEVAVDELTAVLPASRRFLATANVATTTRRETMLALAHRANVMARRLRRTLRHGWQALSAGLEAHWPTVRRRVGVGAAMIGQALVTAALLIAAFTGWAWREGRERLRESERRRRSRAGRTR